MKRITHADEELVTSDSVADELVEYAVRVSQLGTSSAVTIPVLEANGQVSSHTLVVNAASQFAVVDIDGSSETSENGRFRNAVFPPIGNRAQPESDDSTSGFDDFEDATS
jgi:hypothetical protein